MNTRESQQCSLLKGTRFLPLFITQFFGAFNDNAFKNAFLIWFTYDIIEYKGLNSSFMVSVASGLFILPFFLFSATAGQLADKYEKAWLTQKIKLIEIFLMLLSALCFYFDNVLGLLVILFAMGVQSTFFGPIKYSLLPELLDRSELICANSYIEAGTFLSILLGTLLGGLIILTQYGVEVIGVSLIIFSIIGYIASCFIPSSKVADINLKVSYNVWKEAKNILFFSRQNKTIWQSINAISWFWFIGATFLMQFPVYTKEIIFGNEEIVTLFIAIFSIGIAIGSALCNYFVKGEISAKIVPYAGFAISIGILFFFIGSVFYIFEYESYLQDLLVSTGKNVENFILGDFLDIRCFLDVGISSYIIVLSLLGISVVSGLYIVPLYALMQERSEKRLISRIIAGNNIINSIFMVMASLFSVIIYSLGFEVLSIFFIIGLLNVIFSIMIMNWNLK